MSNSIFTGFFLFFFHENNLTNFLALLSILGRCSVLFSGKTPNIVHFEKRTFAVWTFRLKFRNLPKKIYQPLARSNLEQNHDVSFSYLVEQSQCFQDFLGNINMNGVICEIVSTDENAALIDIWCVIYGPGYFKFKVVKKISTQIMNSYTFQIICWNYFFSSTSSQIFPHNRINYSCDFHNFTMTVAMSIGNKFQFL